MEVNEAQVIVVEIGYGDVKVKTKDKCFKFPSAVERQREAQFEYEENDEEHIYEFKGKKYSVGERALTNAVSTRGFNFLVNFSSLLTYHAIKLAGLDTSKPIKVITGLSIVNWDEKDEYTKSLQIIKVDEDIIQPDIVLLAQGQGVFLDYKGDKGGIICIADIGYNTFDFLVFKDGKPQQNLSYATKKGVNEIVTELQRKLIKKFKFDATEQAAKKVFSDGFIMHYGEKIDLTDEIEEAKSEYAEFILDEMRSKGVDLLRSANKIIFSGGGAYFLSLDKLTDNSVLSEAPYEFANARGYYGS